MSEACLRIMIKAVVIFSFYKMQKIVKKIFYKKFYIA